MRELWAWLLGAAVVLLGMLAYWVSTLRLLDPRGEFLLFQFFWPALFFSAGLARRVPWPAIGMAAAICGTGLVAASWREPCMVTVGAGMLALLWSSERSLDAVLERAADTNLAARLTRRGGIALLTIPVAAVMYGIGLEGFGSGRLAMLACGGLYFITAAVFRRRDEFLEQLAVRWRIKLAITIALSLLVAAGYHRLLQQTAGGTPVAAWRLALHCASYAFLGWRFCFALYGWARSAGAEQASHLRE